MKKLEINITRAVLKSFSVIFTDNEPVVDITLSLQTEGGKSITSYSISSSHYNSDMEFELPHEVVMPIMAIAKELEVVATKHCRDGQLGLGEGK